MKPRIVRETSRYVKELHESFDGPAYLALPWPGDCPWTPDEVMGECAAWGMEPAGVPDRWRDEWVLSVIRADGMRDLYTLYSATITAGEPRCGRRVRDYPISTKPCILPKSHEGKCVSADRRQNVRERRTIRAPEDWLGGRRGGKDRRKA